MTATIKCMQANKYVRMLEYNKAVQIPKIKLRNHFTVTYHKKNNHWAAQNRKKKINYGSITPLSQLEINKSALFTGSLMA